MSAAGRSTVNRATSSRALWRGKYSLLSLFLIVSFASLILASSTRIYRARQLLKRLHVAGAIVVAHDGSEETLHAGGDPFQTPEAVAWRPDDAILEHISAGAFLKYPHNVDVILGPQFRQGSSSAHEWKMLASMELAAAKKRVWLYDPSPTDMRQLARLQNIALLSVFSSAERFDLSSLQSIGYLQMLSIAAPRLSRASLQTVGEASDLRALRVRLDSWEGFQDEWSRCLKTEKLVWCDLSTNVRPQFVDNSLVDIIAVQGCREACPLPCDSSLLYALANMKHLEYLRLANIRVQESWRDTVTALPQVQTLNVASDRAKDIHDVAKRCPSLRALEIAVSDLDNLNLEALICGCPHLESIRVKPSAEGAPACEKIEEYSAVLRGLAPHHPLKSLSIDVFFPSQARVCQIGARQLVLRISPDGNDGPPPD